PLGAQARRVCPQHRAHERAGVMAGFDVRLQRVIDAAPDVAFRHWVDADGRREWYAPDEGSRVVESETDPRVGGSYRTAVVGSTGDPDRKSTRLNSSHQIIS